MPEKGRLAVEEKIRIVEDYLSFLNISHYIWYYN